MVFIWLRNLFLFSADRVFDRCQGTMPCQWSKTLTVAKDDKLILTHPVYHNEVAFLTAYLRLFSVTYR